MRGFVWLYTAKTCSLKNPVLYNAAGRSKSIGFKEAEVAHLLYFEAACICGFTILALLASWPPWLQNLDSRVLSGDLQ